MTTLAQSAYGTQLRFGDGVPLPVLTVTAASHTSPIVVTTSVPHGVIDFSYAFVAGVGGNTAANGAWIVETVSPTTLRLRGSVGNGAYTSGGTLLLDSTFVYIVELTNVLDAGSRTDMIDTSAHDGSGYSSEVATLKRTNTLRLALNLVSNHPTHNSTTGLLALFNTGLSRHWLLVLPPKTPGGARGVGHLYGKVDYYTITLPVNGVQAAEVTLAFDGAFVWT